MYNRWMPPPDELYHHGVKGMKWGVRKQPDPARAQRKRQTELDRFHVYPSGYLRKYAPKLAFKMWDAKVARSSFNKQPSSEELKRLKRDYYDMNREREEIARRDLNSFDLKRYEKLDRKTSNNVSSQIAEMLKTAGLPNNERNRQSMDNIRVSKMEMDEVNSAEGARKLRKYEERYQKQIAKANKKLAKADKRATSYWYNEDEVISKYRSAARSKKKADKIAKKGAKLYEHMRSQLDDALFTEESTKLGQTFVDRVTAQSKETYLRSKKYA